MKNLRLFNFIVIVLLMANLAFVPGVALGGTSQPPAGQEVQPGTIPTVSAFDPAKQADKPAETEPAGQILAEITEVGQDYLWSQALGTYTDVTTPTVVTSSCDDTSYNNIALPFSFTYNAVPYTAVSINCNGFLAMGISVTSSYAPLSTGSTNNVLAILGMDLQTNLADSDISYGTLGTAPDRIFVIQWRNFRNYNATGESYNFQIRLHETTNQVEFAYGAFLKNTTSRTPQIGLRGSTSAYFNNRSGAADWTASTQGTVNTATMLLSQTFFPPSGLTWTWTIAPPYPDLRTSTKAATSMVVAGEPITYTIQIINNGTAPANAATLIDPIPAGTTYGGDVSCTAGTCLYNAGLNQVEWTGTLAIGESATVIFTAGTVAGYCGSVVNTATIDDPESLTDPVVKSTATQIVSMLPNLLDGFEISVPPAGWTETIVNDPGTDPDWSQVATGSFPTILPHSGGYMARFNSFSSPSGASARLATGALDLSAYAAPVVVFWMSHDTGYASNNDLIQVQVSTDGVSWTNVGDPVLRYDPACTTACWQEHIVQLSSDYAINGVYIGFLGVSAYGNYFYMDDVALAEAWYPCESLSIGPDQAQSSCSNTAVTYTLVVENNTSGTDTFDLDISGNDWPTVVEPASVEIEAGDDAEVVVTVNVPIDANVGDVDTATITAVGQDNGWTDDATVATTYLSNFFASDWQDMSVVPDPDLFWGASYYDDGAVCVVGGLGTGITLSDEHACYEIETSTWFTRTALPVPVFAPAYGLIDGKFYVAGGFADDLFTATDELQIFDIAANTWITGTSMLSPRGGQASGVVDGKLYSAGGAGTGDFPLDCVTYEYDPVSDGWTQKAACPLQGTYGFDLGGSVGSDVHGRLFAGGHFGAYYGWYAYDPVADVWETLANLPVHKTPLMVENPVDGMIYSIGGLLGWTGQAGVSVYDYTTDTWADTPPDLLTPQGGSLGPAHGSFGDPIMEGLWTVGGTIGSGPIAPAPVEFLRSFVCATFAPEIDVTPLSLEVTLYPNETETAQFTITNLGDIDLNWTASDDVAWASASPTAGIIVPAGETDVTVTFDSTGLPLGTYTGEVCVASDDPDEPTVCVDIELNVIAVDEPEINITPLSLEVTLYPNETETALFTIENLGDVDLLWTATDDVTWASANPTAGTIVPAGETDVTVTFDSTGLTPGTYTGEVCVASNDTDEPEVCVALELTVITNLLPPAIEVDPLELASVQAPDTEVDEILTISNAGDEDLEWSVGFCNVVAWADNFDSYETDISLHGVGGWKGWANDPAATAYTSDLYAVSAPNSVEVISTSDLVHEYTGYDSGMWEYRAMLYLPDDYTGQSYFIMLNQYDDAGATNNWSLQVMFDDTTGLATNFGISGGTLPLIYGEWVELKVVIDLDNDTQEFYYGGDLLYAATWTEENSGGGILNIAAVDLFGNSASEVYYDDITLSSPSEGSSWLTFDPVDGLTPGGEADEVTVTFDSTGLAEGEYTDALCIASNDPETPVVEVPVTLTVEEEVILEPDIFVDPLAITVTLEVSATGSAEMVISNVGDAALTVSAITIPVSDTWVTVPVTLPLTIAAGDVVTLTVDFDAAGLEVGEYATTIAIASDDPDEPTVVVDVTLIVIAPPGPEMFYLYMPVVMVDVDTP